jgi:putative spermidine/putrescine transport system permease protein
MSRVTAAATVPPPPDVAIAPRAEPRAPGLQNSPWLIAPAVAFIVVLFVLPLGRMFQLSLFDPDYTLEHYAAFAESSAYLRVLLHTVWLALSVGLICLVLGYPVAYAINSTSPRTRRLFLIPVMLPYLTSLMVRTYAWMVLLGREGLVNQFFGLLDLGPFKLMNNSLGVYVGMVHVLLPLMILPLCNTMRSIDMRLVHAAEGLGATPFQAFLRVFVPLSLPGVAAGLCLVFIVALGFFVTPAVLGGLENMTVSMMIENQVGAALNWGFASALGVLLLLTTMLTIAGAVLLVKAASRTFATSGVRLLGGGL